jgi:hypothetical protein
LLAIAATVGVSLAVASPAAADCGNRSDFVRGRRMNVIGLTAQQHLVRFRECSPDKLFDMGAVSGFQGADSALIGIDFRVQDGSLYGVGNAGGVYTLDASTATLHFVNQLTETLDGSTAPRSASTSIRRLTACGS